MPLTILDPARLSYADPLLGKKELGVSGLAVTALVYFS
jgi:hypothetical protein